MNIYLKYNIEKLCRLLLHEKLQKAEIPYTINSAGSVSFPEDICEEKYKVLLQELENYGIEIANNPKKILVQRIKSLIVDMLYKDNSLPAVKISAYLADTLDENYRTLSQVFSEECHMSIESFIIFRKIELVKHLLTSEGISLTEISHRMQYSSVAHLSNQFKNVTGLNPSAFQRLSMNRRKLQTIN
ncbi:MAG: helix-turn-helix domain-containing protein [Bacteroidia bacterium]